MNDATCFKILVGWIAEDLKTTKDVQKLLNENTAEKLWNDITYKVKNHLLDNMRKFLQISLCIT